MSRLTSRRAGWRLLAILAVMALLMTTLFAGGAAADGDDDDDDSGGNFTLTILHNNDGESELLTDGDEGGVARFATLVRQEKKEATGGGGDDDDDDGGDRGVILVSSGDNFLASPAFSASQDAGRFFDAIAVELLKYDALAIGNHEFDFGPDVLAEFIGDSKNPPFLSANLDFSGEPALAALVGGAGGGDDDDDDDGGGDARIFKSVVVDEAGEEIGIIGATTENLPFISSPRNVVVNAVLPAVQAEIDRLEGDGVDKIILISHLQDVDGDVALAEQLSGIDVMIAGGGDELLANPDDPLLPSDGPGDIFGPYPIIATNADGADVPVVTTSGQYGYLGKLVVEFDADGNVVAVDDSSGPLRVVSEAFADGVKENRKMNRKVVDPVADFVAGLATTVIAQTEVELDGIRANVRSMETNEGNLIADSQLWQAQQLAGSFGVASPDVALQNGGGIRNDSIIAAGADPGAEQDITLLDTFDMVPFSNLVTIVPDIPRSQFKEILENAVSRTQLGDTPGGTGRFAQIAGFSMTWSGSGTAQVLDANGNVTTPGTRVQKVVLDGGTVIVTGGAVVAGPDVTIAITDFLARGGDQYPFRGAPFTNVGVSYQQALANYIQAPTGDGGLGGLISETDYPEGGEGRNTELP